MTSLLATLSTFTSEVLIISDDPTVTDLDPTFDAEVPVTTSLFQNYPNPFRSKTHIEFSLPTAGSVRLVVFDTLGREVVVLVDDYLNAGRHTNDFQRDLLPSGIYFSRLQTPDGSFTQKMVMVD